MSNFEFLWEKNIIQIISILGGIQGLILGVVVLFYPKIHRSSNLILSLFIFSLALILLAPRIRQVVPAEYMWPIYGVRFSSLMLLYFYIKSLYRNIKWSNEWWNFVLLFAHITISLLESVQGENHFTYNTLLDYTALILQLGTFGVYFYVLFDELKHYKRKVENNFSSMHQVGYRWSKQLVWGFLIMTVYQLIMGTYYAKTEDFKLTYLFAFFNTLIFTIYMYFIAIKGKLNPLIYKLRKMITDESSVDKEEIIELKVDAKSSFVSEENTVDDSLILLAERIRAHLKENKSFLNPTITLNEFADELNCKSYLVSQAINKVMNKSFFDLMNGCRVEEAKKLLVDQKLEHLSILGIGLEAGFNSKTTFNTTFKKFTGLTPTAFKNQAV